MDPGDQSPSRFDDNKRALESSSTMRQDLHSTKKNLFIQEFQNEEMNRPAAGRPVDRSDANGIMLGSHAILRAALDDPTTPEQKLKRYLSLKLSADFRDLLAMSGSTCPTGTYSKQKHVTSFQVFGLFASEQDGGKDKLASNSASSRGRRPAPRHDFICLPDFGENARVNQIRDADSILDSLFS